MPDPEMSVALVVATAKVEKRLRTRRLASVALLIIGGLLLYRGFADRQPLSQTFGVIFILYSGVMQVRAWSAKRFVRDAREALTRKPGS